MLQTNIRPNKQTDTYVREKQDETIYTAMVVTQSYSIMCCGIRIHVNGVDWLFDTIRNVRNIVIR